MSIIFSTPSEVLAKAKELEGRRTSSLESVPDYGGANNKAYFGLIVERHLGIAVKVSELGAP